MELVRTTLLTVPESAQACRTFLVPSTASLRASLSLDRHECGVGPAMCTTYVQSLTALPGRKQMDNASIAKDREKQTTLRSGHITFNDTLQLVRKKISYKQDLQHKISHVLCSALPCMKLKEGFIFDSFVFLFLGPFHLNKNDKERYHYYDYYCSYRSYYYYFN